MERDLTAQQWRALQTAPLWVLSAIAGRQREFEPLELAAFWRAVDDTAAGAEGLAHTALTALSADLAARLRDHEGEERSVVTGCFHVTAILGRLDPAVSGPYITAVLEVGERLARARGAYGRVISREDTLTLQLLAALLEVEPAQDHEAFA